MRSHIVQHSRDTDFCDYDLYLYHQLAVYALFVYRLCLQYGRFSMDVNLENGTHRTAR